MKRSGFGAALLWALSVLVSAQAPAPGSAPTRSAAGAPSAVPPPTFQKYCFECHGDKAPEAGLSLEYLVKQREVGPHFEDWERVLGMLDEGLMPPSEASAFPTDAERAAAIQWVRSSLEA